MLAAQVDPVHCSPLAAVLSFEELAAQSLDDDRDPTFDIVDPIPSGDRSLISQDASQAVGAFLESLSARERSIIRRSFWDDWTQARIALELGVSPAAISKTIAKVLQKGRRRLAAYKNSVPCFG